MTMVIWWSGGFAMDHSLPDVHRGLEFIEAGACFQTPFVILSAAKNPSEAPLLARESIISLDSSLRSE